MFPELCFIDETNSFLSEESESLLKNSMLEEEYDLITKNTPDIKFKFKVVEIVNSLPFYYTDAELPSFIQIVP